MSSNTRKYLSTLAFACSVAGVFALIVRRSLFAPSAQGLAVQALAFGLMVWARITFGRRSFHFAANPTDGALVTWGPYRYVRNPIYAALVLFTATSLISHLDRVNGGLFGLICLGLASRALLEEAELKAEYGEAYRAYAARTARVIPFVF